MLTKYVYTNRYRTGVVVHFHTSHLYFQKNFLLPILDWVILGAHVTNKHLPLPGGLKQKTTVLAGPHSIYVTTTASSRYMMFDQCLFSHLSTWWWWDKYHTGCLYFPEYSLIPILDWVAMGSHVYLLNKIPASGGMGGGAGQRANHFAIVAPHQCQTQP